MNELKIQGNPWEKLSKLQKHTFLSQMVNESAVMAVNFSKDRFVRKSWRDKTTTKWKPRKRKDRGSLMVRTGRLKRSIRKITQGNYYSIIGTDVPYARGHNEGERINKNVFVRGFRRRQTVAASVNIRTRKASRKRVVMKDIKVRSHKRRMNMKIPQRKFLGASHTLALRIERYMQHAAKKQLSK